ncbi:ribosomal protein L24, putative [Acanthamoeba castellanii str. Neff]|uniref:Ribosomal protein L24, putative n=1 Tax=Acanthamoeba castellanii (strain ATCC 30010 / Neff) TaxID=1257118 RepID=L8HEQ0_ACACF|nr:ribosomal protein L24, putative [Acanthamoeba castellanii str. Neff]ELR23999.1 ribosomal protein L24, putative [Acanthamoeba castellanii str. Neff]
MLRAGSRNLRSNQIKNPITSWKIVRGDTVQVMQGADHGKKSVVIKVSRKTNRVVVRGIKLAKRRIKATEESQGGFVYREQPIHYSNVSLVDPSDGKPCKISMSYLADGTKVRVSKRTGTVIPKPAELTAKRFKNYLDGVKDTKPEVVTLKTFDETSLVPELDELTIAKVHEKLLLEKEEAEQKRLAREQARVAYGFSSSSDEPRNVGSDSKKEEAEVV